MDFASLAAALDGNAALQRRARLAAFSFAVLGGTAPVTVRVGERIIVEKGAAANAAFGLTASPATWLPMLGILSCLGLLAGLGEYTWIRLGIWIAIGLVIYFTYGRFRSRLRAK